MTQDLIELLREARFYVHIENIRGYAPAEKLAKRIDAALAQAEAQPEAVFTMEQFGGLVGLARDHASERAVVYKATDHYGETCHFGVASLAHIWAKHGGKVEEVPVRWLRVVSATQPAAPAVLANGMTEAETAATASCSGLTQPTASAVPADVEDRIEAAYWNFDARRKGYGRWATAPMGERDAFKSELRSALAQAEATVKDSLTDQPDAPAVPDEAELKFLDEWLTFATEPVGLQCCGRSRGGECCMDPEPTYPSRNEVIDAMAARHRELTAMLAAAPKASAGTTG